MRVGFFTDTFRPNLNGVVVSMECFAAELRRLGCRTVVFAPRTPHTTVRDLALPSAAAGAAWTPPAASIERVHWVPSLRFLFEQGQRVALPLNHRLIRIARDERLDLIHTHTPFQMGYAGVRVSRALGLPLLHTYHTYFAEYVHYLRAAARIGRLAAPRYSRWFCNLHDRVLAPSHDIRDLLQIYGVRRPVEVFQTGVRLPAAPTGGERARARAALGLPGNRRLLLYVGRLAHEKNVELLLEVIEALRASPVVPVSLLLVGDGPARAALQRRAAAARLDAVVRFAGWVRHEALRPWFLAADCFAFPSRTETQGLSLLEAMAHRLPVVAVTGPGVRDLIDSGRNGLLVDPDAQRFAAAVRLLLDDRALADRLSRGAHATAAQLGATQQSRQLHERYLSLVGGCRRPARRGLRGLAARAWEETIAWR